MNIPSPRLRSKFAALALLATAALPAFAQTPLSGNVYDGSGGPLLSGVVYHVTGAISLPAGQTLTIQPGAIVKFVNFAGSFSIFGNLNSNGTSGNPVIFTDIRDDTAGGDTNGDTNTTSPGPGWWRSLYLYAGSTGSVNYTQFRYGGQSAYGSIDVQSAGTTLSFNNCTMRDNGGSGMQFNGNAAPIAVTGCTFQNNVGYAIEGVPLSIVSGFTNNTATGNGGNYVHVTSATLTTNLTLNANNCMGGAVVIGANPDVGSGVTLTLNAGVVLKASVFGEQWTVHGTLLCNGNGGAPVIFTELRDDSAGGDTNGDAGASVPVSGYWRALFFYPGSDPSFLDFVQLRYGGQSGYGGIDFQGVAPITVRNSIIRNCAGPGIQFNAIATGATVARCRLQNNAGNAIESLNINNANTLLNNTASGNGGNFARITSAGVAADMTLNPNNCMNGALVCAVNPDVPLGVTLTLNAGVVFKASGYGEQWTIHGKLVTNGSSGNPVVFTELRDDTAGGDTNSDGAATSPAPQFWRSLFMYSGSAGSTLDHCEVHYGGQAGYGGIDVQQVVTFAMTNSKVRFCGTAPGLTLNNILAPITVSGCAFNNNGVAIESVPITMVPGFTNNTATANAGNYLRVTNANVDADTTINANNCLGGALVVNGNAVVSASKTLTLNPGVVWKWQSFGAQFVVSGLLQAQGIAGNGVVFTDFRDDTAGGDTNNDLGASVPGAGWWRGFFFGSSASGSSLDFVEHRYGGQAGYAGIEFQTATAISITNSRIRNCGARAVNLNNTSSAISMRRCALENNAGIAIDNVLFETVPGFNNNTATGNVGNYIRVTSSTITSDITIGAEQCMGGALVLNTNIGVPVGSTLTFEPGVVLKFQAFGAQVVNNGAIVARGGVSKPIVFTEFRDDGFGGDTNGDGAGSLPGKGFWRGLFLYSTPQTSALEDVIVRYCGQAGYPAVSTLASGLATLNDVRVEHSVGNGFDLPGLASEAHGLVAWDCDGNGINLLGGAFNVRQATCVACGTGLRKNSALWTGIVRDSIAWANTANYTGFAAGDVAFSDGLAGGAGNINTDPTFVDQLNGNLHLLAGSPCVDTGDPASPLDPNCSPADMGAYPLTTTQAPFTYCTGKPNSAGCIPAIVFNGSASMSSSAAFDVRAIDVLNNKSGLFFYGFNGQLNAPFQGGLKCVADPVKRLPIINSGGSPTGNDCTGVYTYDLKTLIQGGSDVQMVAGATVDMQCWYRDPGVATTTGLSNALQFRICN